MIHVGFFLFFFLSLFFFFLVCLCVELITSIGFMLVRIFIENWWDVCNKFFYFNKVLHILIIFILHLQSLLMPYFSSTTTYMH